MPTKVSAYLYLPLPLPPLAAESVLSDCLAGRWDLSCSPVLSGLAGSILSVSKTDWACHGARGRMKLRHAVWGPTRLLRRGYRRREGTGEGPRPRSHRV